MMSEYSNVNFTPFILLTDRLVLVPTPIAINLTSYRELYASLHASVSFCEMAFSHHFPARAWTDEETREMIYTRDVLRCWAKRGMGDFAVGLRKRGQAADNSGNGKGRMISGAMQRLQLMEGSDLDGPETRDGCALDNLEWAGYAGIRDATTTSMPEQNADDPPLPPWEEMIELRYGVAEAYWGRGIAKEAAEAVMQWAASERDVRRFIAETEKGNGRSGRVLEKMGFSRSATNYWQEPSEWEWERFPG